MIAHLRPALVLVVGFTVLCGLLLPLGFVGGAQLLAPWQANGSLLRRNGVPVGSDLIGQAVADPRYFQPRPSATTAPDPKDSSKTVPSPDNADNSSGSNLGPTAQALVARVRDAVRAAGGGGDVPADMVTTSASGLDPDISPENAARQVRRVAAARHLPADRVAALVVKQTEPPLLGFLGAPRVNVLRLDLALDRLTRETAPH